jgi:hypothetical protein
MNKEQVMVDQTNTLNNQTLPTASSLVVDGFLNAEHILQMNSVTFELRNDRGK